MAYTYSPISSPDGVRDVQIDCSGNLETLELLSSVTLTSLDTTLVTISSTAVNTAVLTGDDGEAIGVGKGLTFRVTTVREDVADVKLKLVITGDSGTKETITIIQPVVKTLAS